MNKINSMSPISRPAAKEGQGQMKQTDTVGSSPSADAGPSSKVVLTGMAQAMMQAQKAVDETQEIDEQRVVDIQAALSNGSYQIDADRIASALIDSEKQF